MANGFGLIVPLILALCGVAGVTLVGLTIFELRRGRQSGSWPQVRGLVLESNVIERERADGGTIYSAEVTYGYTVSGDGHKSDRIDYEWPKTDLRSAKRVTDRYLVGQEITVYHHPVKPSVSVLEPGPGWTWANILGLLVGVVFLSVPVLVLLRMITE